MLIHVQAFVDQRVLRWTRLVRHTTLSAYAIYTETVRSACISPMTAFDNSYPTHRIALYQFLICLALNRFFSFKIFYWISFPKWENWKWLKANEEYNKKRKRERERERISFPLLFAIFTFNVRLIMEVCRMVTTLYTYHTAYYKSMDGRCHYVYDKYTTYSPTIIQF